MPLNDCSLAALVRTVTPVTAESEMSQSTGSPILSASVVNAFMDAHTHSVSSWMWCAMRLKDPSANFAELSTLYCRVETSRRGLWAANVASTNQ